MSSTSNSRQEVIDALQASHRKWPFSTDIDTITEDPWPLAWDAAAFIEEWFAHHDHTDVEEAICHVPINAEQFGYNTAEWHSQHSPDALLKAHILRIVKGWGGEKALHDYLTGEHALVTSLGFSDGLPSQTTLWRAWNDNRLSAKHQEVLTTIGQIIVDVAREHDIPAPDEVFHPNPSVDAPDSVEQDDATVRDRTIAKTREVWKHAKPMVTKHYELQRADNVEVHENAFWEAHAFIGSREEMYAEKGTWSFAAETTRKRVQTGSTHRHHLQKMGPGDARRMHRETTRELVKRARQDSELTDGVATSIDITKSNPYRTGAKLERDGNNHVTNTWLLGYKNDGNDDAEYYFQWASIQIVGQDIPLVLDSIPVHRGMSRTTIVDQLLSNAKDIVDIELVIMDREFDGGDVKDVCEKHGVHYLNPGRMFGTERATCTRLRKQDKLVHIEATGNTDDEDLPTRKRVYLPAINADRTNDEIEGDDEDVEAPEDDGDSENNVNDVREQAIRDLADATDADPESVGRMFGEVIDEIQQDENQRTLPGSKADKKLYILFETNHPNLEIPDSDASEAEKAHVAARMIRRYKHRWGIENGFKQIKSFRVRTTSMKHEYRFFNFLFACTLYNVWRLVDLLVKLELQADNEYSRKPLVTADLFLTIAKDHNLIGLDPPPD